MDNSNITSPFHLQCNLLSLSVSNYSEKVTLKNCRSPENREQGSVYSVDYRQGKSKSPTRYMDLPRLFLGSQLAKDSSVFTDDCAKQPSEVDS